MRLFLSWILLVSLTASASEKSHADIAEPEIWNPSQSTSSVVCPAVITTEDIPGCPKLSPEEKEKMEQLNQAIKKAFSSLPATPADPSEDNFQEPTQPKWGGKMDALEKVLADAPKTKNTEKNPPSVDPSYYEGLSPADKKLFDKYKGILTDHYNDGWGLPIRLHPWVKKIANNVDKNYETFQKAIAARVAALLAAKGATKALDKVGPGSNPKATKDYDDELEKLGVLAIRAAAAKTADQKEALMVEASLKRKTGYLLPLWTDYLFKLDK